MKRVIWQPEALADFDAQMEFMSSNSQQGASLVAERLFVAIDRLSHNQIGRHGRYPGTYEFHVAKTSLVVVYALPDDKDTLNILRIIHTSRDWPEGGWPEE